MKNRAKKRNAKALLFLFAVITFAILISILFQEKASCKGCNIILISIDTLRADGLGAYGNPANTSPNIDKFAAESIIFKRFFSNSPHTAPSHMTMMTSLLPLEHGICNFGDDSRDCKRTLQGNITALAEILKREDYRTFGFTGGGNVHSSLGFSRGFDRYEDYHDFATAGFGEIIDAIKSSQGKFFLFLHTYKIHDPYFPDKKNAEMSCSNYNSTLPSNEEELREFIIKRLEADKSGEFNKAYFRHLEEFLEDFNGTFDEKNPEYNYDYLGDEKAITELLQKKENGKYAIEVPISLLREIVLSNELSADDINYLRCLYEAEVNEIDSSVKEFFEFLEGNGYYDNTIIIFTSDHGEEFFEHAGFLHETVYNEVIHVPFLIHMPNARPGIVTGNANHADLMPSILELIGIKADFKLGGKSLLPLIRKDMVRERKIISQAPFHNMYSMIIGNTKLIYLDGKSASFDIDMDFHETSARNVTDAEKMLISMLLQGAPGFQQQGIEGETKTDSNLLKQLKSLGYI